MNNAKTESPLLKDILTILQNSTYVGITKAAAVYCPLANLKNIKASEFGGKQKRTHTSAYGQDTQLMADVIVHIFCTDWKIASESFRKKNSLSGLFPMTSNVCLSWNINLPTTLVSASLSLYKRALTIFHRRSAVSGPAQHRPTSHSFDRELVLSREIRLSFDHYLVSDSQRTAGQSASILPWPQVSHTWSYCTWTMKSNNKQLRR